MGVRRGHYIVIDIDIVRLIGLPGCMATNEMLPYTHRITVREEAFRVSRERL
jgi:hypothetical protein